MTIEPDARSLYLRNGYAHLGRLPDRTIIDDLTAEAARLYEQPPTRRELLIHPGEIALNMHRLLAVEQRSEVIARTLADPVLIDTAAVFLGHGLAAPAGATLLCAPPRSPSPRPARLPRPDQEHHRPSSGEDLVHLWLPLPSEQVLRVAFLSHTDAPSLGPWARWRARRRRAVGCGMCAGPVTALPCTRTYGSPWPTTRVPTCVSQPSSPTADNPSTRTSRRQKRIGSRLPSRPPAKPLPNRAGRREHRVRRRLTALPTSGTRYPADLEPSLALRAPRHEDPDRSAAHAPGPASARHANTAGRTS
ncbi:hypothetical protein [Embleya sp. NPDC059259]|uniref:hypothetical protein n=1 Tax=unclassified Embleya TaxID=2699296 RepID=UPI0036B52672